jgi:hypothetical protein
MPDFVAWARRLLPNGYGDGEVLTLAKALREAWEMGADHAHKSALRSIREMGERSFRDVD